VPFSFMVGKLVNPQSVASLWTRVPVSHTVASALPPTA
jgi:hypothetical protein